MREFMRLGLPKTPADELTSMVDILRQTILEVSSPEKIILFGSAVTGKFDAMSDIDLVVIYPTPELAIDARKVLYRSKPLKSQAVDYLCVDRDTFEKKSTIGGIYYLAAHEGRVLFDRT